jgi:hypothetical protein
LESISLRCRIDSILLFPIYCARNISRVAGELVFIEKLRLLDDSGSVDLLVLPGVSAKLGDGSESTGRASFLPDVVRVPAAAAASDVCAFSSSLSERGCSLSHRPIRA